ncbi:MAG: hypothetical protein CMC76_11005 [Flavobacteriaceae bacterium]|nr:hypothetical protein [Flavobacteriaceae bacterium]|tara:strand:+ start:557 stop:751 length:195 start_codon:yes stop_codon:yes gene_type:complete
MKKRHEQKLIVLSIALFLIFNVPFVLIFSIYGQFLGVPVFYLFIFLVWLISLIISYIVLKRHYE